MDGPEAGETRPKEEPRQHRATLPRPVPSTMTSPKDNETMILTCTPILVDAKGAAAILGLGRTLLYQLHASGRLGPRPVKLGKRSLWVRAELEDWAAAGCPTREEWLRRKPSP